MITVQQIEEIINPKLEEINCFAVDVIIKQGNKITVLLDSDTGVTIDNCVAVSRCIEFTLNRDAEDFELNVMSAGLSEPFKITRQYKKHLGKQVEVLTKENKKIIGKLLSADDEVIQVETKTTERVEGKKKKQLIIKNIKLNYTDLKSTKLILLF